MTLIPRGLEIRTVAGINSMSTLNPVSWVKMSRWREGALIRTRT